MLDPLCPSALLNIVYSTNRVVDSISNLFSKIKFRDKNYFFVL